MNELLFLLAGLDPSQAPPGTVPVLIDARRVRGRVPRWRGVHMGDMEIDLAKKLDLIQESARIGGERPDLPRFTEADFALLSECGANTVRFGFEGRILEDDDRPGEWKEEGFAYLADAVAWGDKYGIAVILDNHNPIGRAFGGDPRLWTIPEIQDRFVHTWEEIARRFGDQPGVAAYELINEAEPPQDDAQIWNDLCRRTLEAVRRIDPHRPVIIDSVRYANAAFFPQLAVTDDHNTIYSFHNYEPSAYHCQKRTWIEDQNTYFYPGEIRGKSWNRQEILQAILPALEFGRRHKVPLFCGEFGCVSDCPPMTDMVYLMDEISLFQETGISWTMYNFMQLHREEYWRTHFDCSLYTYFQPEQRLLRFGRKIALVRAFAAYDGEVLQIEQPVDDNITLYGLRRTDRKVMILAANKDRESSKELVLALPDTLSGVVCRLGRLGEGMEDWADAGGLAPVDGWLRVSLPKLSITRIEYPLKEGLHLPLSS